MLWLLAATASACHTTQPIVQVAPTVAATEVTLDALQALPERPMTVAPDRFEPSGRMFGIESDGRCQVWQVDGGTFLGEYPVSSCEKWPAARRLSAPSLHELRPRARKVNPNAPEVRTPAPGGIREAVWKGADLAVRTVEGERVLAKYAARCARRCGPIEAVAWSPDGELLALAHNGDAHVQILRASDGSVFRVRALSPGESVLGDALVWGQNGLVALARALAPLEEEAGPEFGSEEAQGPQPTRKDSPLRTYVWTSLENPPAVLPLDDVEMGDNAIILDPSTRYLFISGTGERLEGSLVGYDLHRGIERIAYVHGDRRSEPTAARVEVVSGTWIPGPHPVWETIEVTIPEEGERTYTAWRLYTAPNLDGPRLERIDLPEAPGKCHRRRVQPDGRTIVKADHRELFDSCSNYQIDPSAHLRGIGKAELQRTLDGLTLHVGAKGCLTTDTGYYSCLALGRERRYVVGKDPERALFLRGDQLLPLFYRQNLIEEFLDQQVLPAPPRDAVLGLPPRLRVENLEPEAYLGAPRKIWIDVADGGSGVSTLRVYREGELLGTPIPVRVGRQSLPMIPLGGSCRGLELYVCNAPGQVCSTVVPLAPCATQQGGDAEAP